MPVGIDVYLLFIGSKCDLPFALGIALVYKLNTNYSFCYSKLILWSKTFYGVFTQIFRTLENVFICIAYDHDVLIILYSLFLLTEQLKEFKHMFDLVLEGEKQVDHAKNNLVGD